jgi:hypothetical protein
MVFETEEDVEAKRRETVERGVVGQAHGLILAARKRFSNLEFQFRTKPSAMGGLRPIRFSLKSIKAAVCLVIVGKYSV